MVSEDNHWRIPVGFLKKNPERLKCHTKSSCVGLSALHQVCASFIYMLQFQLLMESCTVLASMMHYYTMIYDLSLQGNCDIRELERFMCTVREFIFFCSAFKGQCFIITL